MPERIDRGLSAWWLAFSLAVALVAAKAVHWGSPWTAVSGVRVWLRDVVVSAHADIAFAVAFGLIAWAALRLAASRPAVRRAAGHVLLGLGLVCVGYAVVAVHIFDYLRSPLTYPLLYLAGDMTTMRSSIGSFISLPAVAVLLAALASYAMLVRIGSRYLMGRAATVVSLAVAAAWIGWGAHMEDGRWSDRSDVLIAKNPHWELVSSFAREAVGASDMPALEATFPPEFLDDFRPAARPEVVPAAVGNRRGQGASAKRPRNAILVVLESTSARYLGAYGGRYPATPALDRLAREGLVFDGFYSHAGFTANSLAALSLSLHPYMTWREYTKEHPTFPGHTVAEALKPLGDRTGFITAQHLDYVGMDRFLSNRGFDDVLDWRAIGKGEPYSSWGGDDATMVDATLAWLDKNREQPFFATLWTQQTHHPYDVPPGAPFVDFFASGERPADDYDLGRYLNNLAIVDRELGRLFAGLTARGLGDDTIVLVTGDHGEAFGEPHATWGHGFRVYEENVRVPLLVWNPVLFDHPRRVATIGGHVDLNPTIADLLGAAPLPSWEGRSLFAESRPPRAYFYAANDHYLLGVREERFKYVYNVSRGREELFDLAIDPDEQRNVAAEFPDVCRRLRQRLAAWKHHAGERLADARRRLQAAPGTQQASLQ